jgi:hypothetical protein
MRFLQVVFGLLGELGSGGHKGNTSGGSHGRGLRSTPQGSHCVDPPLTQQGPDAQVYCHANLSGLSDT